MIYLAKMLVSRDCHRYSTSEGRFASSTMDDIESINWYSLVDKPFLGLWG